MLANETFLNPVLCPVLRRADGLGVDEFQEQSVPRLGQHYMTYLPDERLDDLRRRRLIVGFGQHSDACLALYTPTVGPK